MRKGHKLSLQHLKRADPEIFKLVIKETLREEENIELIASENFASLACLEAAGSCLTNKYAEGYPYARWYGGCEYIDEVERLAIERAKALFGAEHVNVQPHSGTQANMAVYFAVLKPGDTLLAMDLACGGHLSHGHPHNFSGKLYKVATYGLNRKTEMLDYNEIESAAKRYKPKLIVAGASAYPRMIDFKKFRAIADKVGAYLLVDMAHIAGLVSSGLHPSPVPHAEFVTTTTHKTLRGPRGGMILCKEEFARKIDAQVFPGIQGGPLMHIVAAKAVALHEAGTAAFKKYQKQVIENAACLARELGARRFRIVAGGTDTHLLLADLSTKGIAGADAQELLDKARITVNKNLIPFDKLSPSITSGLRLGTPAVTTRGMGCAQMREIADMMNGLLSEPDDADMLERVRSRVKKLTLKFPLYKSIARHLKDRCQL